MVQFIKGHYVLLIQFSTNTRHFALLSTYKAIKGHKIFKNNSKKNQKSSKILQFEIFLII